MPVHLCQPVAKVLRCGHPQRGTAYSIGDSEYLADGAARNEWNIATQQAIPILVVSMSGTLEPQD